MFLEPLYEGYLAAVPYGLSSSLIGLVISAGLCAMVLTMATSSYLTNRIDPYTQHTLGFVLLCAALPFLGPATSFHLPESTALFVCSLIVVYVAIGLIGPTQSTLCLRILSQCGLGQQEVAAALAVANVSFSTLGSLCGPLVAGALTPRHMSFEDVTALLAGFTAVAYLPSLYALGRYKPGPRPRPCAGCIACCSFVSSCCCPCCRRFCPSFSSCCVQTVEADEANADGEGEAADEEEGQGDADWPPRMARGGRPPTAGAPAEDGPDVRARASEGSGWLSSLLTLGRQGKQKGR